ncbi:photosynthetic NDH subunit of lumenal location 2, chloroplastic [Canna indica]|uniref:Photosynthetic NDH subunit of lumenal location 2, chloroplastic n=1 Tax=Canna indica TaxID=4628 RepID=A0AAQ3JQ76_9LILI|nr:photosynthetic NDH subunit of lumenal location 2, chloroplastic [Canna indica]
MGTFAKHIILCHMTPTPHHPRRLHQAAAPVADQENPSSTRRWTVLSTVLTASAALGLRRASGAAAQAEQSWGTRSFIKEKYFQPGLTAEEAVARIRQTAEGMRDMRHMLDTMAWRYVMFYVRLKSAYLDADLKSAMAAVPEARRQSYVKTANELVDNMAELDRYIRSPKVYESYLYYEKTLKSLDELVALLA